MESQRIKDTKWFLGRAGWFVFIVSILDYLVLFLINSINDNFIITYFNMNILLVISVVSGLIFVLARGDFS